MKESLLTTLIKRYTQDDHINLKKICDSLGIIVKADLQLEDYCKIARDKYQQTIIWLNPKIDSKSRFTLIAIAVAEFILHPERIKGNGITYDMFSLQGLHRKKHAPYMMLATRLAIPEVIIEKLVQAADEEFTGQRNRGQQTNFDSKSYIENSMYLPQFIRCVVKESSGKMLLENIDISDF